MRIFLTVLILIFSFQSLTKSDDIKDFQIEGMSVGDSLLNFFDKSKIDNEKIVLLGKVKKFLRFVTYQNLKTYDKVLIYFINEKDNYKISSIRIKEYPKKFKKLYERKR